MFCFSKRQHQSTWQIFHGGRLPHVEFANDAQRSFWKKRRTSLQKCHNTTDEEGRRSVCFPWKAGQWTKANLNNLAEQWHSIDSVFALMESASQHSSKMFLTVENGHVSIRRHGFDPIDVASSWIQTGCRQRRAQPRGTTSMSVGSWVSHA